ncbi:HTTM domain-containing protein [uncultured Flavobacterium sp.]|uniref:HTTM domain-containing protein n=1 Tax=uncultured Flavobacterium sp. TaxID=165435 RepID=UPI0030CA1883
MKQILNTYFNSYTSTATLAFYRLAFGLMMLFSLVRFAALGWIEKLYILPINRFTYYGFEWIPRLGNYTYLLFLIAAIAAFCVAIGYKYRVAILTFFLCFTYIELLDKTTYLNHYYFISIVSFVFIFLPANAYFSVDAKQNSKLIFQDIPKWNVDILKVLIAIVYIYAGLAKINSDWLLEAMPLKIWLPTNNDLPIIKIILNQNWVHYAFSWAGMVYDLAIPFLLLYKPTRKFAFILVVLFHVLTRLLFPIGVFPFVMIVSSLVFFEPSFHENVLKKIALFFKINFERFNNTLELKTSKVTSKLVKGVLITFIVFQLLFPFRYLLYANELFWTEEGFRFSWRVMLMEKAGYTQFKVVDSKTNKEIRVNNSLFLTTFQEKQMAFQPDFILEYAHILENHYKKQGVINPQIYVESYVALNGRLSQKYIDPSVNLANETESFKPKNWILPFNDEIKGL